MKMNKIPVVCMIDSSVEMACVCMNGDIVLMGNFWDFHPGVVRGLEQYGNFRGPIHFAYKVADVHGRSVIFDRNWKCVR